MMDKSELLRVCREILSASPFEHTEISASSGQSVLTRYGGNRITQNVKQLKTSVSIRGITKGPDGKRTARVECDQLDRNSIEAAYKRLENILRVLPGSEEVMELLAPGDEAYAKVERRKVQLPDPEIAAGSVAKAVAAAAGVGFEASGVYSADLQNTAYVNSRGLELCDELADSEFSCTMEGRGGAGRGFSQKHDSAALTVDEAVATALEKCRGSSAEAGEMLALAPGHYDVVLEPAAVAELLVYFGWVSLSAKAYLEERSYCFGKLGQPVLNPKVTLFDDPLDPEVAGAFYDGQGAAKHAVKFVEQGVLRELASDIRTAKKLGRKTSGHGVSEPNADDPIPWNIGMEWHGAKVRDSAHLISQVKRGILVTQFHYTNLVDVMVPSLTGMTRNGTFLIENGRVTRAVRNFRFTQSMKDFFDHVEAATDARTRVSTFFGGASLAPSLLVRDFNFSSGTEF